jgi:hypothetical protein
VKRKIAAAIFALVATPPIAFAQQSGPPKAPKPTKADVQKVVEIILGDKAKLQYYCDSKKIYQQMGAAYQKNDSQTADALNKKADAVASKIGPEYAKLRDGLEQVDPKSSEGKEFMSMLSGIDKQCTGSVQAKSDQLAPIQYAPRSAQSAVAAKPCAQIKASCTQAGFVPNGASMGIGINVDCIRPIMAGTQQRKRATKPLPQIDPELVVACKNQNPNFGMGGAAKGQPSGQPNTSGETPNE